MPDHNPRETLDGVLERFLFQSDDEQFAVAVIKPDHASPTLKAAGELSGLHPGERVRLIGEMREDARFGRQFKVSASYPLLPHSVVGLKHFLAGGRIQSIGPKLAERMVNYFKERTLKVILEEPERLTEVNGIGPKRAREIAEQVKAQASHRDALIFLQSLGIQHAMANRLWKQLGEQAISRVRANPYTLAQSIRGIGFRTADQIALELGFASDSPARIAAGLVQVLSKAADDGNVMLPREILVERCQSLLGDQLDVDGMITTLVDEARLIEDFGGIYLEGLHRVEVELSQRLVELSTSIIPRERLPDAQVFDMGHIELAPAQKQAVRQAVESAVMVLTGGPGTGKTTTVRAILNALERSEDSICLAAPTGRAARRLSETTSRRAATLHRLLGFHPSEGFRFDQDNPLSATTIVVDEASMLDVNLALGLVRAIAPGTRLILVGDADQLPSVGPGRVLRDVIASARLPMVRLTSIFRQSEQSQIVVNAHRVLAGLAPLAQSNTGVSDFYVVHADTPDRAADLICTMVEERIPRRFGLDPKNDIQVLAPMHRGICGAKKLNDVLQERLNPTGAQLGKPRNFRVGDKVMQIRNDYQKDVFNGDLGTISGPSDKGIIVRFDERVVEYARDELDALVLAYAVSVHKSQGSEYPAVIVPMLTEHWVMLQRNLLYTAMTRGKKLVIVVGQARAIAWAAKNIEGFERHTRLAERMSEPVLCG